MSAESYPEFQFQDAERQHHAAKLAVWLFLSTEVMFFSALFAAYTMLHYYYPQAFSECSHHMERWVATFETADLLTSSLFMALAIHATKINLRGLASLFLFITFLGGAAFLILHGHEYWKDASEGALPGRFYHLEEIKAPGAGMFYAIYFFMTGLHSIHVFAGMCLIGYVFIQTRRGQYSSNYYNPVEGVGLYWHFVDMVWVFLYPLFYLLK
jgi:cytochrome c oxidase subunit III